MKRILSIIASLLLASSYAYSGDVTIGLQTGAPALLGARIAYMGGTADNRDMIVDGTLALTVGWTGNIGAGYALAGGPWYLGARYHYFSVDFLFVEVEGGAIGPEIGYITPIFGSQNIYFNAFLGAALRDDFGDLEVVPTGQIGLNIRL